MRRGARSYYYFFSSGVSKAESGAWRPNTDIYETDDHVVVCLEVAGVSPGDISVMHHVDRLVVRGVRRPESGPSPKRFHQIEIVCGEFEKEILLSGPLRGAHVEATLSLGVLSLRISKESAGKGPDETSVPIDYE